ncbi:hypothetical protein GGI43DRAFT_400450 [Trichoderma evansii]
MNISALELSTAMMPQVIYVLFLSGSLLRFIKHITHFVYNLITTFEVLYFKHMRHYLCHQHRLPAAIFSLSLHILVNYGSLIEYILSRLPGAFSSAGISLGANTGLKV